MYPIGITNKTNKKKLSLASTSLVGDEAGSFLWERERRDAVLRAGVHRAFKKARL